MAIWLFMFIIDMCMPLIMFVSSFWYMAGGPKSVNNICGYRTKMSMLNDDTWLFAHTSCGKLWLAFGSALLAVCIVMFIILYSSDTMPVVIAGVILFVIETAVLSYTIYAVEKRLKKTFSEDGYRK